MLGKFHGDWCSIPLGLESSFLGGFEKGSSTGTTGNLNLKLGKRKSFHWDHGSWEIFTVDEDTGLVSDINNDYNLSIVFSVVNVGNSSWFNKSSVTLYT